jgi:hypothetical protein
VVVIVGLAVLAISPIARRAGNAVDQQGRTMLEHQFRREGRFVVRPTERGGTVVRAPVPGRRCRSPA